VRGGAWGRGRRLPPSLLLLLPATAPAVPAWLAPAAPPIGPQHAHLPRPFSSRTRRSTTPDMPLPSPAHTHTRAPCAQVLYVRIRPPDADRVEVANPAAAHAHDVPRLLARITQMLHDLDKEEADVVQVGGRVRARWGAARRGGGGRRGAGVQGGGAGRRLLPGHPPACPLPGVGAAAGARQAGRLGGCCVPAARPPPSRCCMGPSPPSRRCNRCCRWCTAS
jgi:hypothetical protein